ncbi:RNA polymerase sigma factor [Pontibacter roseus]|uniref:RNA polymerase sigma factor n=1 Tax=Pontibacter roseus TaxID=336989 RepID=UPI000380A5D1|nr:sigma-70 family RNA polymerase sigma factor [Pontibacter roseus]
MFLKLFTKERPPDDAELVQQYRRTGDMAYIGKLFERHTDMVYLVCMKYLQEEEESKDATMHIFEQLVEALKKHEVGNFKSWLHVLSKNHCLQLLRAQKARGKTALPIPAESSTEMVTSLYLSEDQQHDLEIQALEQGLTELPPEQRTCLELFYLQHRSYKEIAVMTGCELSRVKSHIQNGRRNLKIYVEKHHAQR